jgi:uncharacterized membrane protein
MDKFLDKWGDPVALLITLMLSITLTIIARKRSGKNIWWGPAFLFFFGSLIILVPISFHLLQNGARAIEGALKGTFTYNFHFYSVMLMGIVLAYFAWQLTRDCLEKSTSLHFKNIVLFKRMALIVLVTVPTIPIIPIGALPTIGCIISLTCMPFVRKRISNVRLADMREPAMVASA